MNPPDLIIRKRDGEALTEDELRWIIAAYTAGDVPDYQMAALLMAIYFKGMDGDELAAWTDAMLHSGDVLDFSDVAAPKVDKHSTGGVGDKVSIPLAPMVAACGVAVPMMSGRGLGHTGGTLDKLESIPGFTTALDPERYGRQLRSLGIVLAGQSDTLVPADRRIYALRDTTGTVASIPLIASSIMSKKLAEGLDALILDVKVGRGAFMRHEEGARKLAETMVGIGTAAGTQTVAVLTAMDQPLGNEVGNANEITESIEVLRGGGPADLLEVVYRLGREMLLVGGITTDAREADRMLEHAVASGEAAMKFQEVIAAQGGDPEVVSDPGLLPTADFMAELNSPSDGYVTGVDALGVGRAAVRLGAGRTRKEDHVDPAVGITLVAKVGDLVETGDPLARLAFNDGDRAAAALELLERAWEIGEDPPPDQPIVIGEVR